MELTPLPTSFIGQKKASKRVLKYQQAKHKLLSTLLSEKSGILTADTTSVWYSKEQVQDWLNEMTVLEADGLRIYLGEMEEASEMDVTESYEGAALPGQLCLVIVPTKSGTGNRSHVNVIYETLGNYDERKRLAEDLKKEALNSNEKAINFGGYCPPMHITEGFDYAKDSLPLDSI
jgi:hypothetical protein